MAEDKADWADQLALDIMASALGNPYKLAHRYVAEQLRDLATYSALRGAQEMADKVHRKLDFLMGIAPDPDESVARQEQSNKRS